MNDHHITPTKTSISVVDDIPDNLCFLAGILTEQEYIVQPAGDGSQALSIAQGIPFQLKAKFKSIELNFINPV